MLEARELFSIRQLRGPGDTYLFARLTRRLQALARLRVMMAMIYSVWPLQLESLAAEPQCRGPHCRGVQPDSKSLAQALLPGRRPGGPVFKVRCQPQADEST